MYLHSIKYKNDTIIALFLSIIFLVSFISESILNICMICSFFVLVFIEKDVGALKYLIFIFLRQLINPAVGCSFSGSSTYIKFILIFASCFVVLNKHYVRNDIKNNNKMIIYCLLLFSCYSLCVSFVISSFPFVSCLKIISYFIPFVTILFGVSDNSKIDWLSCILFPFAIILFAGLLFYNRSFCYMRNNISFQGFVNHPNALGIMVVIFLGGYLSIKHNNLYFDFIIICLSMVTIYLSGSRTSLLSAIILICIWSKNRYNLKKKFLITLIVLLFIVLFIFVLKHNEILIITRKFFEKSHAENFLYSRENQIINNIERFLYNPLFGTGFGVPYSKGFRDFSFSFDFTVENGNLVLALLGDIGIIGVILFSILYILIFVSGEKSNLTLYISPILVSMGEMSFFSTNNFALIYYFYFALYLNKHVETNKCCINSFMNLNIKN